VNALLRILKRPVLFSGLLLASLAGLAERVSGTGCVPAPAGLIHWYRGEGDGTDAAGGNPGSLETGVTITNAGEVGRAFLFNGVSGGINLGNVPDLDFAPDSSFSIEAWINSSGPASPANESQIIVRLNNNCGNTDQSLGLGNAGPDIGRVFFQVRDANGVGTFAITPTAVSSNQFHHLVGVRDVNGTTRTLRLYLDGVLVDTETDPSTGALALDAPDVIGRRNTCTTDNVFNGIIDEVSIYNRALTDQEVQGLYSAGSAGKCYYAVNWFKVAGGGNVASEGPRSLVGTFGQPDASGPLTNAQFSLVGGFWALPVALQTPGAPTLQITAGAPGFATVSWTPVTPGFHLQVTAALTSPAWTDVPSVEQTALSSSRQRCQPAFIDSPNPNPFSYEHICAHKQPPETHNHENQPAQSCTRSTSARGPRPATLKCLCSGHHYHLPGSAE